ncbi:hypothetical protein PMAYCL1PPCAC_31578 [Pristionchus mayeri]|uniref:F-box domain-containing protein n=1 Tax=Pristionchus mayeri TaxID=1317129 RepID=A0AAN5DD82_9BILA|nr:hypothetical protein PMAYCL1PPCAC_31578 [Pristionchus mayeri]
MLRDPGIDLATKPVVEQMREMALHRSALLVSTSSEINGEYGDYFSFFALPAELITHTFSFLPNKDRLKARVNKQLTEIEAKSTFYVKDLSIEEVQNNESPFWREPFHYLRIIVFKKVLTLSDIVRMLSDRASIDQLTIKLCASHKLHGEIYDLTRKFKNIGHLNLQFANEMKVKEIAVDAFFLDLSRSCKSLSVQILENVSTAALYEVYKNMVNCSTKLRKFECYWVKEEFVTSFFVLIGITIRDGLVFSNEGFESYTKAVGRTCHRFFYGSVELLVVSYRSPHRSLFLTYHETSESLEAAKKQFGWFKARIMPL